MDKNMFQVIGSAWERSFPLLPRIRRSFWGLLLFCAMFLMMQVSQEEKITVVVMPNADSSFHPTNLYGRTEVMGGQLVIHNPTLAEKLLLKDQFYEVDSITLFFLMIASIIIIVIVPKIYQQNLFRKDISNAIRLLGYLTGLHGLASLFVKHYYARNIIETLTNNEFTGPHGMPFIIYAEFYFALVIIALAGMYRRGVMLQKEQDLTV